jgi:hypothetical protein
MFIVVRLADFRELDNPPIEARGPVLELYQSEPTSVTGTARAVQHSQFQMIAFIDK